MTVIWQLPEKIYMDRENKDLCIGLTRYVRTEWKRGEGSMIVEVRERV